MFQVVKPLRSRSKRTGITISKPKSKGKNQRTFYISRDLAKQLQIEKDDRALIEFDPEAKQFRISKQDGDYTKKVVFPDNENAARISLTLPEHFGKMLKNQTAQYNAEIKEGKLYFSV